MISNQVIINCLEEAKEISKCDFLLADNLGNVISKTNEFSEIKKGECLSFLNSENEALDRGDTIFLRVECEEPIDYALVVKGFGDKRLAGKFLASQLHNLMVAYKDKVDKNSFFQNLLLDNLLLVDIYNRAQKLHIEAVCPRCVFVIELNSIKDPSAYEMVRELFNTHNGDFVTTVDEDHIVVIKTLSVDDTYEDMDADAKMLVDMFSSEAMMSVRVSYGTIVSDIKGISKSYKEANMALDVGKIFYTDKNVVSYSSLGIGRLIFQLPINLCEMYIDEVFGGDLPEEIDDEILYTINKFLDNSLNVSETARQLYIHRNTLIYRIEKLEKATGMDVRNFEDALSFRIAMMVLGYVSYVKNNQ